MGETQEHVGSGEAPEFCIQTICQQRLGLIKTVIQPRGIGVIIVIGCNIDAGK